MTDKTTTAKPTTPPWHIADPPIHDGDIEIRSEKGMVAYIAAPLSLDGLESFDAEARANAELIVRLVNAAHAGGKI